MFLDVFNQHWESTARPKLSSLGKAPDFKEALIDVLEQFIVFLDDPNEPSSGEILDSFYELLTDLRYMSLNEVYHKYFSVSAFKSLPNASCFNDLKNIFDNKHPDICIATALANETFAIRDRLIEQAQPGAKRRNELLRFLLQKEKKSNKKLACYVLPISDLSACLEMLTKLYADTGNRFQLIVQNDNHYTAVDLCFSNPMKAFVMDAAADIRRENITDALAKNGFSNTHIYIAGDSNFENRIQNDDESCSIFSLDNAIDAAKMPDLYGELQSLATQSGEMGYFYVQWENLPPELVRHAQSPTFFTRYAFGEKETGYRRDFLNNESVEDYIQRNLCEKTLEDGRTIQINGSASQRCEQWGDIPDNAFTLGTAVTMAPVTILNSQLNRRNARHSSENLLHALTGTTLGAPLSPQRPACGKFG